MVLALLLGFVAGSLLRGRQGVRGSGRGSSIVDGDPVAGLAVVSTPAAPATTDPVRPAATVDPAPSAVADEPSPVDTVTAPATVTAGATPDGFPPAEAPSTVDPADMALTDAPVDEVAATPTVISPRPAPEAERFDSDVAPSDSTAPAEVTPVTDAEPTAVEAAPVENAPVAEQPVENAPVADEPVQVAPVADERSHDRVADVADAPVAATTPVAEQPADVPMTVAAEPTAATVAAEPAVAAEEPARPVVATPPVRPTTAATPPVRPAGATLPATGDSDPDAPADDFRRIQGVGPKMAAALQAAGVRTYRQLGDLDEPALRDLIRAAGLRAAPGLASWPQQARVLAGAGDELAGVLPGDAQG
ncbi:hypothetical protein ACFOW4_19230 [Micromonospora sp. GCM10011542]|uniref:hypothetical protein n=1 Tax=Micromonospora sp. GCM10011542 TaxID=3317337 RepID=UPI00360AD418